MMYNPPHPGQLIKEEMSEWGLSVRMPAKALDISHTTVQRLVNEQSDISSDMAVRLSEVIDSSPEAWLAMQNACDLRHARNRVNVSRLCRLYKPSTHFQDGIPENHINKS